MKPITGTTLVMNEKTINRLNNGVKQGLKDVVNSYIGGNNKAENFGSKGAGLAVGGAQGLKEGKQQVQQTKSEMSRLQGGQYAKSATANATIAKTTAKAAIKGLGVVGFIPDAITFSKGFVKGVKSSSSKSGR